MTDRYMVCDYPLVSSNSSYFNADVELVYIITSTYRKTNKYLPGAPCLPENKHISVYRKELIYIWMDVIVDSELWV